MVEAIPLFVLRLLGFAGFIWLGLYVLSHGDGRRVAILTGVAALATASFFFEGGLLMAMRGASGTATVNRALWWADVLPIALWFHLSVLVNPRAGSAPWRAPVLWAAYGAAAALTVVGTGTTLINDYDHVPVAAGRAYALYVAYVLACTGFAVVNFAQMRRTGFDLAASAGRQGTASSANGGRSPEQKRLLPIRSRGGAPSAEVRLLITGGVCFLLGAGYLVVNMLLHTAWYELPAYILLLAGMAAVAATVTFHGALLTGKDLSRDALYSIAGLSVLLGLFLVTAAVLVGFGDLQRGLFALLLAALITAVHTLHDAGRAWLDAVFFSPPVRLERAAARAYATALAAPPVGHHPDLATVKAFDDAVRRALTNLSDPTKLATTPLLNLVSVARGIDELRLEDDRLNRAAVLREMLLELLDSLRPQDGGGRVTSDAWRYYNCLYYPYVRGISRRRAPTALRQLMERRQREGGPRSELEQALDWLTRVDEDTFYKWQRRGSDTIAAALRERETAAGGIVPAVAAPVAAAEAGRSAVMT